jgi:hypothetical protein
MKKPPEQGPRGTYQIPVRETKRALDILCTSGSKSWARLGFGDPLEAGRASLRLEGADRSEYCSCGAIAGKIIDNPFMQIPFSDRNS